MGDEHEVVRPVRMPWAMDRALEEIAEHFQKNKSELIREGCSIVIANYRRMMGKGDPT